MPRGYDEVANIFSPDGRLQQLEYAHKVVNHCSTVVALRNKNCIVMGLEKKALHPLQKDTSQKKIVKLDSHVVMTYAGLTADARVLTKLAQEEAQSYRRNYERPANIEYIARYVAKLKQHYTQDNGRRPFGLSCLIAGFDMDGQPHLYQTEPSGVYHEWVAYSTGRQGPKALKHLEKISVDIINALHEDDAITLVLRSLILSTSQNANCYEIAVLKHQQQLKMISSPTVSHLVQVIKRDNAAMEGWLSTT